MGGSDSPTHQSFAELSDAFREGRVRPALVTHRLVRAAFRTLSEAVGTRVRADLVASPFPPPFDMNWYLGTARTPFEVSSFVNDLNRPHTRVWSVIRGGERGWRLLVQVTPVAGEKPVDVLRNTALISARKLKSYAVSSEFIDHGKPSTVGRVGADRVLSAGGSFVEMSLVWVPERSVNRREHGNHVEREGRIPFRSNVPFPTDED